MGKRTEEIQRILRRLISETPDVVGAVLADMNGLTISSIMPPDVAEEDRVAAEAAVSLGAGEKFLNNLKRGELNKILIEGQNGYILIIRAGDDAFLSILTSEKAKLGMIFLDSKKAAEELGNKF